MIDFDYAAPETWHSRILSLQMRAEPHKVGGIVYVPEQSDELNAELDKDNNGECYLVHDGKKYPAELDFGFLGMMPITITVGGFRYLVEVSNGE